VNKMKNTNALIIFILMISTCPPVSAKKYSIKQLEQLTQEFVSKQVSTPDGVKLEIQVSKQDPRTKLPDCSNKLLFTSNAEHKPGKNVTVKVMCPDNPSWRQYIPVRVKFLSLVFAAKTQLEKGTTIEQDKIKKQYIDSLYLRGSHFSNKKDLLGAKVKQRVNAGSPISAKQICIVCKNELVTLSVRSAGLELKTQGIAQSNGTIGQQVRVRNKHSKKIVYGRVLGIGKVQINL